MATGNQHKTATTAKTRLFRLTYPDWQKRVNEFLALGGRSMGDFPTYPWRTWHLAGLAPGHVAEVVLVANSEGNVIK